MISVIILAKNGERRIREVLNALQNFPEIILYDTGSTDSTLAIAKEFPNVLVYQKDFFGFGPAHNAAAKLATHDWILSIDADEVLTPALAKEILNLSLESSNVYSLSFSNFFNGKHIKWCGWHPETHVRLYNRLQTQFTEALVHEGIETKNLKIVQLTHPVLHYPYESISDFLQKMERYSSLFAAQNRGKKKSNLWTAIIHAWGAFIKSFIIKKGFLGGYEGFLISVYNSHTAFYKYLKLCVK